MINTILSDNSAILPYQRQVFERLCSYAKASLYVHRSQFKIIKPRCCFWLIGATGTGKTHLSKTVAQEVGVPIFSISVSDWIILGNSNGGSNNTWPLIVKFILQNIDRQGAIIFIDEMDKCSGNSEWNTYLRTEIFSLCDARVPAGLKNKDSESTDFGEDLIAAVEEFLKNKTMIIGGSAFQDLWEKGSAKSMGFTQTTTTETTVPVLSDLATMLPRELVNRFSSEIFVLPEITASDYRDMVSSMAVHIPEIWRDRFTAIGLENIDKAVRDKKGARYLEEVLTLAIVEEKAYLIDSIPQKQLEKSAEIEFKNDDDICQIF